LFSINANAADDNIYEEFRDGDVGVTLDEHPLYHFADKYGYKPARRKYQDAAYHGKRVFLEKMHHLRRQLLSGHQLNPE